MKTNHIAITFLMLSAGLAALAGPAFAQAAANADTAERVLITGSRGNMGARTDLLGASFTILDPVDFQLRQTIVVSDILRDIPGLSVNRSGGVGQLTQIRMRGGEGNHTLVMIDGIEASNPFSDEFDFGTLIADNAARIEVLRGQQSALYGSNAIGGVIHYITLTGKEAPGFSARLEGGTFDTLTGSVRAAGVAGALDYSLNATASRTGGSIGARGGIRHDASETESLSGKLIYTIMDNFHVTAVGRFTTAETDSTPQDFDFPPGPNYGLSYDRLPSNPAIQVADETSTRSLYGLIGGDLSLLGGMWTHSLTLQGVTGESKGYDDLRSLSFDDYGTRKKASYATTVNFVTDMLTHSATFAADFKQETYRNKPVSGAVPAALNDERVLDNTGLVGQYDLRLGNTVGLGAAVRYDMNQHFKNATTYRVQASYRVLPFLNIRAAAGSGVTNPTNFELFGFDPATFIGNPNLKPEKSEGWEAGLDIMPLDNVTLGATYFNNALTDEIFTAFTPAFLSTPQNRATKSTEEGVELWLSARLGEQWRLDANWTNLHALESSPGLQEVRRPPNTASLNLGWRAPEDQFGANLTVRYQSEQRDFQFTPLGSDRVPLKAVTLVNFGADYRVSRTWQLYGRVENLLDTQYEEVFGFPSPGRAFYAGVRATFQ